MTVVYFNLPYFYIIVLIYEPSHPTALQFQPVLEEKILIGNMIHVRKAFVGTGQKIIVMKVIKFGRLNIPNDSLQQDVMHTMHYFICELVCNHVV